MASCIFCDIAIGKAPALIVFEDEAYLAFLDKRPLFPGHTLLIPKKHIPTIYDLPQTALEPFMTHVQRLGRAIETALIAEGTFIAMNNRVSQSVPHLHTHIVPRNKKDGLKGFFWPRQAYLDEGHMQEVQQKIKQALAAQREAS